jgi:1-acyl-sn-glycerol-3-phosphate acyltransferase
MFTISNLAVKSFANFIRVVCGASVYCHSDLSDNVMRIYIANHTSHLDAVMIWASLPDQLRNSVRPVAAKDYWDRTPIRKYIACKLLNAVLLVRPSKTTDKNTSLREMIYDGLNSLVDAVNEGSSLIIFPEGTRSISGEIQGFKSGIFYIAEQCQEVEFVPVYIDNLNRIFPKGEILPVPLLSRIRFGKPFKLNEGEKRRAFITRAKDNILRLRNDNDA